MTTRSPAPHRPPTAARGSSRPLRAMAWLPVRGAVHSCSAASIGRSGAACGATRPERTGGAERVVLR
ncbi:hypothetical protein JOD54_006045 [Actinokineospora baliensis]|uniref:hypothetical protein n=1 Tax=Actinokineospora baliensis TaxID=547056 RepID=UPI001959D275|nr:hypothetical protein [Actinokineospora baliensis]MBM7775841.1 hypothetical protein [Actinokineospora baliensis]